MEQPVDLTVRIEHLGRILRDIKAFDSRLATGLRREIRNSAKVAAAAAQSTVREGGPSKTGLREGIARGIRVSISTGARTNGVRITSSGTGLSTARKPMVKAFNKATFRHPVFGDRSHWVSQSGRPYFGSVIAGHRDEVQRGVLRALDQAARTLARHY